ncbi:hypothetical protein [Rheinheimera aquimaris]|uniref:hypothetical protein n=1 Tax=Rheinheimera aquimaris TaxID=412437 RepID=UPI003A9717F5
MSKIIFVSYLFVILFYSSNSLSAQWEFQCGEGNDAQCFMQRSFKSEHLDFVVAFGRDNGASILLFVNNKINDIVDVKFVNDELPDEQRNVVMNLKRINGSEAFFTISANVYDIKDSLSAGSTYSFIFYSGTGVVQKVPADVIDLEGALSFLGDKFYNKFNFPSEEFVSASNRHFEQVSGISVDESVKFASLFLTANKKDRSVTFFYNYKLKSDYGDDFEKVLAEHYDANSSSMILKMCEKQARFVEEFDGLKKLNINLSLQGQNKNIFSVQQSC